MSSASGEHSPTLLRVPPFACRLTMLTSMQWLNQDVSKEAAARDIGDAAGSSSFLSCHACCCRLAGPGSPGGDAGVVLRWELQRVGQHLQLIHPKCILTMLAALLMHAQVPWMQAAVLLRLRSVHTRGVARMPGLRDSATSRGR